MTDQTPPPPPPAAPAPGPAGVPPRHPDSTLVLVLGIIGLITCQILSPIAWVRGNKAMRDIRSNPGAWSGESEVNIGRILGIVGTVFLIIGILFAILMIVFLAAGIMNYEDFQTTTV